VDASRYLELGCVEVTVKGNGQDLRRLIAKRPDISAAYLRMMPKNGTLPSLSVILDPSGHAVLMPNLTRPGRIVLEQIHREW
jgi:hypothetical protein